MKKRSDADFIHPSETAYDKAIRRMEEREAYILNSPTMQMAASAAEQIRKQQASVIQPLKPLQDAMQSYHSMIEQNSSGLAAATASISSVAKTLVPDDAINSMTESMKTVATVVQPYQEMHLFKSNVLAAIESATITPELQAFRSQLESNVQAIGLTAISDYIGGLASQWDNALALSDVLDRSIAAQNLAVVRMLPNYNDLVLPRGSKKVLKSLTKTTAKKLMESDKIQFDPKGKNFYHKETPDVKFSADQITVVESSLELFEEFSLDSLLSFESKLEQNYAFASRHPVGVRIFEMLENWNHFVSFENITYYHARPLDEHQRPYHDFEMMRAPMNVSAHGRYNEVGRSCYYIAEDKEGALKEIYKHSGGTKPRVQVIGLKAVKPVKLLDLSGEAKKTNRFIEHMRFTVENEVGKTVLEYLLPNYVASCCKEIGIDGIRYKSSGYNCCVLWKDDYFEYVEGSREVIPE